MMMPSDARFDFEAEQCYSQGFAFHGDLGLKFGDYRLHVTSIIDKYLKTDRAGENACCLLKTLCTTDLYLSKACSEVSERAWNRFTTAYGPLISGFARQACRNRDLATDVADGVLANMFLPDRSGQSRIASFDGRCPLAAWLRVTVNNHAAKERDRKCNNLDSADCLPTIVDGNGILRMEQSLRTRIYGPPITDALRLAVQSLTPGERRMLLLRYDEELQVSQIARVMEVSTSSITRRIQAIQRKLKEQIVATLKRKGLAQSAVEECRDELLENVAYSILSLAKAAG